MAILWFTCVGNPSLLLWNIIRDLSVAHCSYGLCWRFAHVTNRNTICGLQWPSNDVPFTS